MIIPEDVDLPHELAFCKGADSIESLLTLLKRHSDPIILLFFESISENETWAEKHSFLFEDLLKFLTEKFFQGKLLFQHAQRLYNLIHHHPNLYIPLLSNDLICLVEGMRVPINSLLFSAMSPFFFHLISNECRETHQKSFRLKNVPLSTFFLLEEYAKNGNLPDLWKKPEGEIINIMHHARLWGIRHLEEIAAHALKRYISKENIIQTLIMAHREAHIELKRECFAFIKNWEIGIVFFTPELESDLGIIITFLTDDSIQIIKQLSPFITHLALRGGIAENILFKELHNLFPKLKALDLAHTLEVPTSYLEQIKNLKELYLSYCLWLRETSFRDLISKSPNLFLLDLSGNNHLSYTGLAYLSKLQMLKVLNLSYCDQLTDVEVTYIASLFLELRELSLEGIRKLTDKTLLALAQYCTMLVKLNLNHGSSYTTEGINRLALSLGTRLNTLKISYCPTVSDKLIYDLIAFCPNLEHLEIKGSGISKETIENLKKQYKYLKLITKDD